MARQTYYIPREQKHPLYRTRMLQAGPIELDAGAARLFRRLGVDLSDVKPKAPPKTPAPDEMADKTTVVEDKPAAKPKAAAPKKKARKRKAKK